MSEQTGRIGAMLLHRLVTTSEALQATRSRKTKVAALAETLGAAHAEGGSELEIVAAYLSGVLRQRRTGVGWRGVASPPAPAATPTLTVTGVDAALQELSAVAGSGSQATRAVLVERLFASATEAEQRYLRGLLTGEVRQGAQDGLMVEAIAAAAEVPVAAVRRASMLSGATTAIAMAAFEGEQALAALGLEVGRPIRPMLASSAPDVAEAFAKAAPDGRALAVDTKLDGIRIQVHRRGGETTVFTRSLDEITSRMPEVVEVVDALPAGDLVLDGEVIGLGEDGRPRAFQETASRGMTHAGEAHEVRLTPYFFDVVHHAGEDLLDSPAEVRAARLTSVVPEAHLVPRLVTADPGEAQAFFAEVLERGHEGVVIKALDAPYDAGRRGSAWVKVKPRHTLDLVVLAVEWGSGRRSGWLSNIHLGARDPESGGFTMLGKTFKGMTDEILAWQTERFTDLATSPVDRSSYVVHVRPEQVVEIAFDGVQRSSRYPGGVALRFARVLRYRDDKTADEADTIDAVLALK